MNNLLNQFISFPVYGKITDIEEHDYVVQSFTYNNELIIISKNIINKSANFSNEYKNTIKCNKHELANKLVFSNASVFTVEFEKQDKTIRKLIGYLNNTDSLLGYSTVIDLELLLSTNDINKVNRIIYHNKLISIIINNTKYQLK